MSEHARTSIEAVDKQHRERARTLSELVTRLILKRKGQLPKSFDEWCQDLDIVKRAHEHIGACMGMNELRIFLWPEEKPPENPESPLKSTP